MPTTAPYGTWDSSITAASITGSDISLGDIAVDENSIYWVEGRTYEAGRNVIVRYDPAGTLLDMIPSPFNARTRVHEYGGGAFTVVDGTVYFTNYDDQRVYRVDDQSDPSPVTGESQGRHADFVSDKARRRLIAVREIHDPEVSEPLNVIASISVDDSILGNGEILVQGHDFYSSPRVSPDGTRLAWLAWNHPNMPWDGTELWVGTFDDEGSVTSRELKAGGSSESIYQPEWSPDGELHFISDRSGWWNLYKHDSTGSVNLREDQAEYGIPQWVFGTSTYAFVGTETIACLSTRDGRWQLGTIDRHTLAYQAVDLPSTVLSGIRAAGNGVIVHAASPVEGDVIARIDTVTGEREILRRSSDTSIERKYLSVPGSITFPTAEGLDAHAFYYPPHNTDYVAPDDELPPLIVVSHGGPTGSTGTGLNAKLQYWTSRGFAVLDVNYGGSTGYGREYRERLNDKWGVVDVDDCVNGALHLAREGLVDPDRLIIRGGSASGYTTLYTLTSRDVFKTGSSHYGIGDLEAMVLDTHKFESRYLDGLIGPYPDRRDLYLERSPIYHVEKLKCPMILFQGSEDRVVPPNQAISMYDAVKAKGLPVALRIFDGEQHGFRKSENIQSVLENELYFFGKVFEFEPAGDPQPIEIANLEQD